MGRKTLTYNEYIASDIWKCLDSPTGAHHWIEIQYTKDEEFHTGQWYCKWCFDSGKFPKDWSSANPANKNR